MGDGNLVRELEGGFLWARVCLLMMIGYFTTTAAVFPNSSLNG